MTRFDPKINSSFIAKTVHTEADIQAGLEEQKIRDKLIELGWTPPQEAKDNFIKERAQLEQEWVELRKLQDQYSNYKQAQPVQPAVAVNEQLLEALKVAQDLLFAADFDLGNDGKPRAEYAQITAAIAAAEELRAQQESKGAN